MHQGVALSRASAMARQRHTNRCGRDAGSARQRHSTCVGQWKIVSHPAHKKRSVCLWRGMNSVAPHTANVRSVSGNPPYGDVWCAGHSKQVPVSTRKAS